MKKKAGDGIYVCSSGNRSGYRFRVLRRWPRSSWGAWRQRSPAECRHSEVGERKGHKKQTQEAWREPEPVTEGHNLKCCWGTERKGRRPQWAWGHGD